MVYNCNEDVVVAAFISEMHVTNPFYKHLVKNDVTKMRDILVRAQKYIQIEQATPVTSSRPPRQKPEVKKPKSQFPPRKNPSHNSSAVPKPSKRAPECSKGTEAELDSPYSEY